MPWPLMPSASSFLTLAGLQLERLDAAVRGASRDHLLVAVERHALHRRRVTLQALRLHRCDTDLFNAALAQPSLFLRRVCDMATMTHMCHCPCYNKTSDDHPGRHTSRCALPTSVAVVRPIAQTLTFLSSPPVANTPDVLRPIRTHRTSPLCAANSTAPTVQQHPQ